MMHVSPAGRKMIEEFEGCRLEAYQDVVGVWTIGFGCTGPDIGPGLTITQEQADEMLSRRLADEFEPTVNEAAGEATQGQFDAMASLAFNIGVAAFERSSVLRYHRAGQYDRAADAFMSWDHAGGRVLEPLERRRAAEGQMYLDASPVAEMRREPITVGGNPDTSPAAPENAMPLGHQKAVAGGMAPSGVAVLDWFWQSVMHMQPPPVAVELAIVGLLVAGIVWLVPHSHRSA